MKALAAACSFHIELAEPRNHRSIGKVERVIGMVQKILNQYNLLLGKKLTTNIDKFEESWLTIETILPFIQLALNQRRPRFTTMSPNMLMFGTNLKDISDIGRTKAELEKCFSDAEIDKEDRIYLHKLIDHISRINGIFRSDWKKYTKLSSKNYSKKWSITPTTIETYNRHFRVGKSILYYIGDKRVARGKWKQKWTGPWRIQRKLNDSTLIISDPETGNQKRVTFDRIKLFKKFDDDEYIKQIKYDEDYATFQASLLDSLTVRNVKTHKEKEKLHFQS